MPARLNWLLFDNQAAPYQMKNLVDSPEQVAVRLKLDAQLMEMLNTRDDEFLPSDTYIKQWHYPVNTSGTMPYKK